MVIDERLNDLVRYIHNQVIENQQVQNEANLTMMEANAENYEQGLQIGNNNLDVMEAIADLYDLITGLSEQVAELKEGIKGGQENG